MINRRQVLVAGMFAPWALTGFSAAGDDGLVRLLIDTPRGSLLEALAARIRAGLMPAGLLRALAIAACREVSPYPDVGFKYHAVMMLQAVQLSMAALPPGRVWLPLLWSADYFKAASAQEDRVRPWPMPAVYEPSITPELPVLVDALTSWDRDRADRATAAQWAGPKKVADVTAAEAPLWARRRTTRMVSHAHYSAAPALALNCTRVAKAVGKLASYGSSVGKNSDSGRSRDLAGVVWGQGDGGEAKEGPGSYRGGGSIHGACRYADRFSV